MATRQYKPSSNIPTVRLSNSRPFITQKAVLNSLHAQQIFERGYDMCANALFSLTVVLRFIGTEEQAQAVEAMVDDLLNKALDEIRQEIARMKELGESNGMRDHDRLYQFQDGRDSDHLAALDPVSGHHPRVRSVDRRYGHLVAVMHHRRHPLRCRGLSMEATGFFALPARYGPSPPAPFWLLAGKKRPKLPPNPANLNFLTLINRRQMSPRSRSLKQSKWTSTHSKSERLTPTDTAPFLPVLDQGKHAFSQSGLPDF